MSEPPTPDERAQLRTILNSPYALPRVYRKIVLRLLDDYEFRLHNDEATFEERIDALAKQLAEGIKKGRARCAMCDGTGQLLGCAGDRSNPTCEVCRGTGKVGDESHD